jgi:hypothetical protein
MDRRIAIKPEREEREPVNDKPPGQSVGFYFIWLIGKYR